MKSTVTIGTAIGPIAGLGFLRLIHLVRASDVLQLLHIVKNRMAVRLTWAASVVATVWMCGACVFYMVGGLTSACSQRRKGGRV